MSCCKIIMKLKIYVFVLILCSFLNLSKCNQNHLSEYFDQINKKQVEYNAIAAKLTWDSSVSPNDQYLVEKSTKYQEQQFLWQHRTCEKLVTLQNRHLLNSTQLRQTYLLCRGPCYTLDEARKMTFLYNELQNIYSQADICIPNDRIYSEINLKELEKAILKYIENLKQGNVHINVIKHHDNTERIDKNVICLKGETDFEKLMTFSKNEEVLRFIWLIWREKIGTSMKEPYLKMMEIENVAARRNGYTDIGATWRDELEIPDLRHLCRELFETVRPLYTILHGIVRFYLNKEYGEVVSKNGPIPAHILGNLWAQDWDSLLGELMINTTFDIDESLTKLQWNVSQMVKKAEDFYQSLGLPAMTDSFWHYSVFGREKNNGRHCHGSAADMFRNHDFRLQYCPESPSMDFYVVHHELGHIEYYMAYEKQPGIFRQGTNSAFHESIGDSIMLGVMTPQHLNRLGLINDTMLYQSGSDIEDTKEKNKKTKADRIKFKYSNTEVTVNDVLLLKQALKQLPHIPFALLLDEYRWKLFEGGIDMNEMNKVFWDMALEVQGVVPPGNRGEYFFDVGAKFHIPDNTPYIRYFLSTFIHHQLFEELCKASVFGRRGVRVDIPDTIPLNRCDIYGSKSAGKILKDIMSRGSSQNWRKILQETTGKDTISADSLKKYYRPLYQVLLKLTQQLNIPIGW